MHLVFLPATAPADTTYGTVPDRVAVFPEAVVHTIRYPRLVWYNRFVRDKAITQIRALGISPIILVGFSKSGLGAWNIARELPDRVAATLIFDSPMTRQELPTWGTDPFYVKDSAWQDDSPINSIEQFNVAMPDSHQLVLISGPGFHDEMKQFSNRLSGVGRRHVFLDCRHLKHHWNSGWIEHGLTQSWVRGSSPSFPNPEV